MHFYRIMIKRCLIQGQSRVYMQIVLALCYLRGLIEITRPNSPE